MTISEAWLLEPNESLSIAISDHEMVEYLQDPVTYPVPGAPEYCNRIIFWQGHLAPVMDLDSLLGLASDASDRFMSLIAFQPQAGTPLQYMALNVRVPPRKVQVDDEQICELPAEISEGRLSTLCMSCFTQEERPVLILDIAGLCSTEYRDLVNKT